MKKTLLFALMAAGLVMACSQKQAVVTVPVTQIDVEKLHDSIDYDMDISSLSLADVRTLRFAPDAQRGFPFEDSYIRGIYETQIRTGEQKIDEAKAQIRIGEQKIDEGKAQMQTAREKLDEGWRQLADQEKLTEPVPVLLDQGAARLRLG